MPEYLSPMHEMSQTTPTQFWNDSCSISELTYALAHGAVGATTNPVIVGQVLQADLERYRPAIQKLIADNPSATEDEIAWMLNEQMAVNGAKLLEPAFESTGGKAGYISIQTNAKYYRDTQRMVEQAVHFKTLAKNIMVKMPVTAAGVAAVEEATYRGVNVNATVSFSVPQALAVAEAVERGLNRRAQEGLDLGCMHPICTIMIGRVEDWLRVIVKEQGLTVSEDALQHSGVAVFKNAYRIFRERGYRTRLLTAAYRNRLHWTEFVGGDISMTIPHTWIKQFVESGYRLENRMDVPVDPKLMEELYTMEDFRRAYEPDGMRPEEFVRYGATRRTLMQFLNGYDTMVGIIRGILVEG